MGRCSGKLDTWPSPNDICSTPSALMPFIDSAELAGILGEPHATVHRALTGLLADGNAGRVSHGTAYLTTKGLRQATGVLGFETPSDFVRAYPLSREWLALLIRRMDAVAAVYRLAALMSPGTRSRRSHVEFHRRGRFDSTITLHDGRDFGVVRQGLALRRRSLYDRLRAIAEYDYTRRPDTVLILVPSVWEERLTGKFCERLNLRDSYIAVETRDALERRDLRLWRNFSWVRSSYSTLKDVSAQGSPGRRVSHGVAGSEAGVDTPSGADGGGCAGLRPQPLRETDPRPHHRPPDDPP